MSDRIERARNTVEVLRRMKCNSIRYFTPNGEPVYAGHDIGLDELESYHYDKIKSEREGINAYVKEEFDSDMYVHTTLDTKLQDRIATILPTMVGEYQGAVIAMQPDGALRAMSGGRDLDKVDEALKRAEEIVKNI